jgi:regulator of sigma E protease
VVFVFEIILGLLILVFLIVTHELGHAFMARRNGVNVEEFGLGLPPKAWAKKLKCGLLFTINWLPIGGFVKLQGEYDEADKKGDYGAATFWQKTKILLAGVVTNWLIAAVILTGLAITGLPKVLPNQATVAGDTTIVNQPVEIAGLTKGHAAEKAGLKIGDQIVRFAGQEVPTVDKLVQLSKENKGQPITVIYDRNSVEHSINVNLGNNAQGGYFGASLGQRELIKATWSAPFVGIATTAQFTWATIQGIGNLIGNIATTGIKAAGDSVAGPIGILGTIFPAAEQNGPTQLLFLTAIISLSLSVMNVLPIPALDGGRWMMMALFKLFRKKLTRSIEEKVQAIGFYVLMVLILLVTINDVAKLF